LYSSKCVLLNLLTYLHWTADGARIQEHIIASIYCYEAAKLVSQTDGTVA